MSKSKDTRVEMVECACGCGEILNKYDGNYRTREYIPGHNGRKYNDPKEYKRVWYEKNKEKRKGISSDLKKKYRNEKKDKLLKLHGSTCASCGLSYDGTNAPVFDFHHAVEAEKEFQLSAVSCQNKAFNKLVEESKKCVLLCANCHRLHHHTDNIDITEKDLTYGKLQVTGTEQSTT